MEFAFEDDIFETKEKPANQIVVDSYEPKREPFGFFLSLQSDDDDLERCRMKANYYFLTGNYETALSLYARCSSMTNSNGAKFEFFENRVRCYLKLFRFDEAHKAGLDLYKSATSFDQQVQALYALRDVFQSSARHGDCAIVLAALLSHFDTNAQFWYSFSTAVKGCNGIPTMATTLTFDTDDYWRICENCLGLIGAAALLRCLELLRIMQIESPRSHLVVLDSKCRHELANTRLDEGLQTTLKLAMCHDINKSADESNEKLEKAQLSQIIDVELNHIWRMFLLKWFGCILSECSSCCRFVSNGS